MRDLLIECYKIEKLAEKVYMQFADNPAYSKAVSETFREMATEEREHARIIDMFLQTPEHELDATPSLTKDQVDEMLRLAKGLLVCAENSDLNANEAMKLALQVEEQLVQAHADNALSPGNLKLTAFFAGLSQYDRDHIDKLQACIDTHQLQSVTD
jgi:rubrerythrin